MGRTVEWGKDLFSADALFNFTAPVRIQGLLEKEVASAQHDWVAQKFVKYVGKRIVPVNSGQGRTLRYRVSNDFGIPRMELKFARHAYDAWEQTEKQVQEVLQPDPGTIASTLIAPDGPVNLRELYPNG